MVQWESWNWKTWHWRKHVSIIINDHCHVLCEGDIITLHVLSTVSLHENSSSIKVLYQPHLNFKQRKNTATLEVIYKNYTLDNASKPISQVLNIVWPQKWFIFFQSGLKCVTRVDYKTGSILILNIMEVDQSDKATGAGVVEKGVIKHICIFSHCTR